MAMVIDDRLKVWEDKDQPRVHVVPAFTHYYAPQAETANAVPVLCVARNVACNVRGGFFKEFDENLLRRLSEHFYEDEVLNLPSVPDVCNYLMSEDASFVPNGNINPPIAEGMNGPEVSAVDILDFGYIASFEILYDTILEAKLKFDAKIKKATKKFTANLEINNWWPRFNDFFWDCIGGG
ncbi:hypothetical protein LXL04_003256 [Taraxacum kok-saghyz]